MQLRKRTDSILAGSILHLHNESQLGENSLAHGIHAITFNHGKSRPQTHIRQQRMGLYRILRIHIRLGTRLCHGEGDNVNKKNLNGSIATCSVGWVCCRLHRAIRWLILKGSWKDDICHAGKKSPARDANDV